jgi:hypothetical protein
MKIRTGRSVIRARTVPCEYARTNLGHLAALFSQGFHYLSCQGSVAGFNHRTLRWEGATRQYLQRSNCMPPGCRRTDLPRRRNWTHLAVPNPPEERADRSALNSLALQHQHLALGAPIG